MSNLETFKSLLANNHDEAEKYLRDKYGLSHFQAYTFVCSLDNIDNEELSYCFGALDAYIDESYVIDQLPKRYVA